MLHPFVMFAVAHNLAYLLPDDLVCIQFARAPDKGLCVCTSLGHEIRGSQPLYRAQFTLHSMHQFDRYEKHFEKVSYCRGVGPIIPT